MSAWVELDRVEVAQARRAGAAGAKPFDGTSGIRSKTLCSLASARGEVSKSSKPDLIFSLHQILAPEDHLGLP